MLLLKSFFNNIRHRFSPAEIQTFSFYVTHWLFNIFIPHIRHYQNALGGKVSLKLFSMFKMHFLVPEFCCLFPFKIQDQQNLTAFNLEKNEIQTQKTKARNSTTCLCLFSCISGLSRVTGISNEASENMDYLKLEVNQKTAMQVFPWCNTLHQKNHYSLDLWQAPWESNLAFQMNGRYSK